MSVRTLGQPVCSDRKGLTLLKLNFWCSMIFLVFSLHTLHSLLWLRLRDLNFTSPDWDLSWSAGGCCGWIPSRGAMISVSHQRSSPTIFSAKLSSTLKMSASDYFQAEWMQQQNWIHTCALAAITALVYDHEVFIAHRKMYGTLRLRLRFPKSQQLYVKFIVTTHIYSFEMFLNNFLRL